jgi:hypothetical protein
MSGSVIVALRPEDDYLIDLAFPAYFLLKGEEIYDDKGI